MTQLNPQRDNSDLAGQNGQGQEISVALINRSGQIWVAVLVLIGGIITSTLTYLQGVKNGAAEEAAKPLATATVSVTTTITAPETVVSTGGEDNGNVGPVPTSDGTAVPLAELTPVRNQSDYDFVAAKVNAREYDSVMHSGVGCVGPEVSYPLDYKYKQFTATVGLADDSSRIRVKFGVSVDGKPVGPGTIVSVGETKKMKINVSSGYRMTLYAEPQDHYCPLSGTDLWVAWINPTLHP